MNEKKQIAFIPFHAINEFMRSDFRLIVLRSTLLALPDLEGSIAGAVNSQTRKHVKVPGFRNSAKAPASVKAVAMVKAFEKQPKLVSSMLHAWATVHAELRQQTYDLLTSRGWAVLPPEFDRRKLPGFLTEWPEEEDYESLYEAFDEAYPDAPTGIDDLSLMIVWLSGRLPIDKVPMADLAINQEPDEEDGEGSEE